MIDKLWWVYWWGWSGKEWGDLFIYLYSHIFLSIFSCGGSVVLIRWGILMGVVRVGVVVVPNPCRHPFYHILPAITLLVYQFISIKNIKNINFALFYVYVYIYIYIYIYYIYYIYMVNGGMWPKRSSGTRGPFTTLAAFGLLGQIYQKVHMPV